MKKFIKVIFVLMIGTIMWNGNTISTQAAGDVAFSVDSVKGKQGSSKTVAVNISNNSEVAGIDCILSYDSSLMEYVDSSKGNTLKKSGFCDINSDGAAATVHLVYGALSGMSKEGKVMTVEFKLLQDINDAYTPQLTVNDLIDASDEMNDLSYVITTNPADTQSGTEEATTTDGTAATADTAQDGTQAAGGAAGATATEADSAGATADQKETAKTEEESKSADNATQSKENENKETSKVTSSKNKNTNRDSYIGLAVGVIVVLALIGLIVYLMRKKRHQKD
ncbi:MAG: cohesin domain-containing protein [Hespellia sp.]|nr:cohesin domain-containing protein [Hespellia sp.]